MDHDGGMVSPDMSQDAAMIRKFVLAAVVGTTVLSGGVAFAAQAQISAAGNYAVPRGPMRADANHDGIVTRAEAMALSIAP